MANPHYGLWGFDDIDPLGYNDDGAPYVRPTIGGTNPTSPVEEAVFDGLHLLDEEDE